MLDINNLGHFDPKIREEIAKQFEKIQADAGVEIDEDYQTELEEMLGMSIDDMEKEIIEAYEILSSAEKDEKSIFVAVRSSATT
jgi:phosphoenolpyruvate synthase/pyruvate phosphate dikinase